MKKNIVKVVFVAAVVMVCCVRIFNVEMSDLAMAVFSSCSSSETKGIKDIMSLPVHTIESSEQYNKQELITRKPWEFHRIGDNFFVFNGVPNSAALVFCMSDCQLLGEFVPKGMGPGECVTPRYAGCNAEEDTVYIYDTSKIKMFKYEIPKEQTDSFQYKFVDEKRSSYKEMHMMTSRLENGLTVSMRYSGTRHMFTLYNEQMDSLCTFGSLPLPIEDDELKNLIQFQGIMTAEGNTIYYGCKFIPYLCAYEVNGKDDIKLKYAHNYLSVPYTYTDRITIDRKRNIEAFRDIKIGGDYLWTTFMGKTSQSIDENPDGQTAEYLLVFNKKDGVPLAKFKLPHQGSHICFSKDIKELYHFTSDLNIDVVKVQELLDVFE